MPEKAWADGDYLKIKVVVACMSMTIVGLAMSRDRLMGIGQAITMPLFFASNALYPVAFCQPGCGRSAM